MHIKKKNIDLVVLTPRTVEDASHFVVVVAVAGRILRTRRRGRLYSQNSCRILFGKITFRAANILSSLALAGGECVNLFVSTFVST